MLGAVLSWLTGGTLARILDTVDNRLDNETERERVKADVVKSWTQASVDNNRADRFFWLWRGMFVVPTGIYYGAIIADSMGRFDWSVAALPSPYDQWGAAIVLALFGRDAIVSAARQLRR